MVCKNLIALIESALPSLANLMMQKPTYIPARGQSMSQSRNAEKEEIVLVESFKPEFYLCDKNNQDSILGRGTYGYVYEALLKDNISQIGLPAEVAIKEVFIKTPGAKHTKTECDLIEKGKSFQNSNLVKMFYLSL